MSETTSTFKVLFIAGRIPRKLTKMENDFIYNSVKPPSPSGVSSNAPYVQNCSLLVDIDETTGNVAAQNNSNMDEVKPKIETPQDTKPASCTLNSHVNYLFPPRYECMYSHEDDQMATYAQHPLVKKESIGCIDNTSAITTLPADKVNRSLTRTAYEYMEDDYATFFLNCVFSSSASESNEDDNYRLNYNGFDIGYTPESAGKKNDPITIDSSCDETVVTAPAKKKKFRLRNPKK